MKATVKEWFEQRTARELGLGNMYSFELFCKIKETEKAAYCMVYTGFTNGGKARKKTMWIPKSVIENIEALETIEDYDKAAYAFDFRYLA